MPPKLRQLIILHRHGARLPIKRIDGDLSWPLNDHFWENYSGQLTPIGMQQLIDIGRDLKSYYHDFLLNIDYHAIRVHCSNSQRTMMSAWSFLIGMFPTVGIYFKYLDDTQSNILNHKIPDHIPIYVESQTKRDKLFHLGKLCGKPKCNNKIQNLDFIDKLSLNSKYQDLSNKFYQITKWEKMNPNIPLIDRLSCFKKIDGHLKIASAHNRQFFPNVLNMKFLDEEIELITLLADQIKKECFIYNDKADGQNASFLLNEIFRYIVSKKLSLVQFSAHDTTILSLAALLKLDIDIPQFAGYFLFEIYDNDTIKIYYNSNSAKRENLVNKKWIIDGNIKSWNFLNSGKFTTEEFGNGYDLFKLNKIYSLLINIDRLREPPHNISHGFISEKYPQIMDLFKYVDSDGDNFIQMHEYFAILERLGLEETIDSYQKIFVTIDSDQNKLIDLCEFFKIIVELDRLNL